MSDAQQRGQANQAHVARIQPLVEQVRGAAHPLTGDWSDFDLLMKMIDDACYVLIGEASHGTHDFYRARSLPFTSNIAGDTSAPGIVAAAFGSRTALQHAVRV